MSIKSKSGNIILIGVIWLVYSQFQLQKSYDKKLQQKLLQTFNITQLEQLVAQNETDMERTEL